MALVAASVTTAAAQPPADTSVDSNRLWLPIGPTAFGTLRGSEVPPHLRVTGSASAAYQHRTVVLRHEDVGEVEAVGGQLDAHLGLALGLWDRFQAGAALPLRLIQAGSGIAPLLGEEAESRIDVVMLGDLRLALDWRVLERGDGGRGLGVLVSAALVAPTGDGGPFTTGGGWAFAPQVGADYGVGPLLFGLDAGARVRTATRALGAARFASTVAARGGVAWFPTADPVSLSLEGGAEFELAEQSPEATESQHVYDLGVGARWSPREPGDYTIRGLFAIGAGGFGAPVFRFVLGLEYGARAPFLRTPAPERR